MSFHIATGIRFCGESIIRIVSFRHGGVVCVGLGLFKTSRGIEAPCCHIAIDTLTRIGGNDLAICTESAQGSHVVHVIVTEASGLNSCTPFRNLTTTKIILVATSIFHCIGYD